MAARTIGSTDTLEGLRTTFNLLSESDFGDIGNLDSSLSATNIIGAVNEIYAIVAAAAGWTITDGSNSEIIGNGQTLTVNGTSNEIEAVVSATDTLTIGLPSAVTITTSVAVSTMSIATGSITDSSGAIDFGDEDLSTTGDVSVGTVNSSTVPSSQTLVGRTTTDTLTNKTLTQPTINTPSISAPTITSDMIIDPSVTIKFEGATDDDYETTLTVTDPTADRTITFPDTTGTVVTTGDVGTVTDTMLAGGALGALNADNLTSGTVPNARLDQQLQDVAGLAVTDGGIIVGDGSNFILESGSTARTSLGLGTSDDIQFDSFGVGTAASGTTGEIRATNDITAFYSSDIALKENIHNIPSASEKIEQLNGVLFDWTQDFIDSKGGEDGYFMRKTDVGVIAQDVEKVLPEIVGTRPDGIKAVKYDRLVALLIEGFKEIKKEINDLKDKSI